jgi:purine-binding chemotaxis protein CheW
LNKEQFIGLLVGSEEFLLPTVSVREIIMLPPITFVPFAPPFIEGIINLRGTILPAINVRKLMGLNRPESISQARTIVVRQDETTIGLIVDRITYVISALSQHVEKQTLPRKGPGSEFIGSICKQGPKIRGILDLTRILNTLQESQETSA